MISIVKEKCRRLINETFDYYEEDPERRSVTEPDLSEIPEEERDEVASTCWYMKEGEVTRYCAVGRCLNLSARAAVHKNDEHQNVNYLLRKYREDFLFPYEYREIPLELWTALQTFHDAKAFWTRPETFARFHFELYKELAKDLPNEPTAQDLRTAYRNYLLNKYAE